MQNHSKGPIQKRSAVQSATIEYFMYNDVINKLNEESSALTPMLRSETYKRIIAAGYNIVPHLITSITDNSEKHYLTLLAIGELNPAALLEIPEATRLKIYLNTLQKGKPHNDWGLAGEYLSGASYDILRMGHEAIPYLIPLLDDTSETGLWGSEEITINDKYQNRVCDFAYYLILQILDRDEFYSISPVERDDAITGLKDTLRNMGYIEE